MDAGSYRSFERLSGALNIVTGGARETGDDGPGHSGSDRLHGSEITVGGNGKPSLDDVHAQAVELASQADFLVHVHAAAWGLLTVAQSRVENRYPRAGHEKSSGIPSILVGIGVEAKLIIIL